MPSKMAKSDLSDLKPPDLWIHGNIEMSELEQASDVDSSTVGRREVRGQHERNITGGYHLICHLFYSKICLSSLISFSSLITWKEMSGEC